MYAFVRVDTSKLPNFDDQKFALDLLERKHVLVARAPASTFPTAITSASRFCRRGHHGPGLRTNGELLDDYAVEAGS